MTLAQDRIEQLRVRGSSSRSQTAAVLRQLSTVDLNPPGLAPSAVLLVRRLQDPLPGQLGRHGEWRLPERWRQALRASLARVVENAARPIDGVLPHECDAVVFADEAELLACLVLDMALGTQHDRWWWQCIVANLVPRARRSVAHLLHHQLPLAPAALTLLDSWQRASLVASALSPQEAQGLTHNLAAQFGVGAGASGDDALARPALPPPTAASPAVHRLAASESLPPDAPPPWSGLLRSALRTEPSVEALFGLAVLLIRSPARAREYAPATARWLQSRERKQEQQRERTRQHSKTVLSIAPAGKPDTADAHAQAPRSATPVRAEELESVPPAAPRHDAASSEVSAPLSRDVPPAALSTLAAATTCGDERDQVRTTEEALLGNIQSSAAVPPARDEARRIAASAGPTPRAAANLEPNTSVAPRYQGGLRTRLGGVFYLVNLLDHLDLPGVFEPEFRLESTLGAWGMLELVSRALLGPECPHHDDPLWKVLRELGGRSESERLGEGHHSAADVVLPERWRRDFMSPLGERRSLAWLSRWVASHDLLRWLEAVLPFLEARLAASMGLVESAPPREAWCVPARIHVAPLHVDVVMSLEDISMAMRRSGLDRSPAWVASFGKIILIHFEGP